MPRIYDLGEYSEKLSSVSLIVGDGLCSNIYVIGKENAVIVDTGIGNSTNSVWPQLEELNPSTSRPASVQTSPKLSRETSSRPSSGP